jgi:formylglycine-generating enzyme required for sulfatase activity
MYRLLSLGHGSLNADFSTVQRVRTIKSSTQALLMESARRSDEAAQIRQALGDTSSIYGPSALATSGDADLSPEQISVLRLFDGSRSIDNVIEASDCGDLETLTLVNQLLAGGFLKFRATPGPISVSMPPVEPMPESDVGFLPMAASQPLSQTRRARPMLWGGLVVAGVAVAAFAVFGLRESPTIQGEGKQVASAKAGPATALPTPPPVVSACPEDMAFIEGGSFFMGSDSSHPALHWAKPAHKVTLDSFCIGKLEVTVAQYTQCSLVGECERAHRKAEFPRGGLDEASWERSQQMHSDQCNDGKSGREQHAVNCVSQHQAREYCRWRDARLPTEAEWEFSARGTDGRVFPWGDAQPDPTRVNACGSECAAWHERVGLQAELHGVMYDADDGYTGTSPVGRFPAGATKDGVMDLIGNVFEWTSGGLFKYSRSPQTNPQGPADAEKFVIRGGAFNSGIAEFSNPALRFGMVAESYSHGVGFRCAAAPNNAASDPPKPSGSPVSSGAKE